MPLLVVQDIGDQLRVVGVGVLFSGGLKLPGQGASQLGSLFVAAHSWLLRQQVHHVCGLVVQIPLALPSQAGPDLLRCADGTEDLVHASHHLAAAVHPVGKLGRDESLQQRSQGVLLLGG